MKLLYEARRQPIADSSETGSFADLITDTRVCFMSLRDVRTYQRSSGVAVPDFTLKGPVHLSAAPSTRTTGEAGSQTRYVRWGVKRGIDIAVALAAIVLLLPILPIILIALYLQDGSPVMFRQPRMGIAGSRFDCLKFRSMSRDSRERLEELLRTCSASRREWETAQKLKSDPRIHTVGSILRRSSIDELPQLINVLRGDMSIVGPRPMLPEQTKLYGDALASYSAVRPGITGLWQVSGRNNLSFEQRVGLDARYAESVTFMGDAGILMRTVWVVLIGHGSC